MFLLSRLQSVLLLLYSWPLMKAWLDLELQRGIFNIFCLLRHTFLSSLVIPGILGLFCPIRLSPGPSLSPDGLSLNLIGRSTAAILGRKIPPFLILMLVNKEACCDRPESVCETVKCCFETLQQQMARRLFARLLVCPHPQGEGVRGRSLLALWGVDADRDGVV